MSELLGSVIKRSLQIRQSIDVRLLKPWALQKIVFRRLLEAGSKTQFGRYYDFRGILMSDDPIETFQQNMPVFDYNKLYNEWWHKLLNNEEDVCWEGKVKYFAMSSGTSGAASKYIPITDSMLNAMRRASFKMFFSLSKYKLNASYFSREMLMIGSTSELNDCGSYFTGDLSGINAKMPPLWARGYYRPGTEVAKISDWNQRIDTIAKMAPKWDIGSIVGVPSWVQLTLERIMEYNKLDTLSEIWPNVEVFVHSGIAIGPYKSTFNKIIGKPFNYIDSYLASEGFIAFQNRPNTDAMALLANNGIFFEFIPFDDHNFDADGDLVERPLVLTVNEVIEGQDYALVMSTCAGAWRYLIGDVIRFTNLEKYELIISGRTKHFLSITGEHLSVDNMNKAIQHTQEKLHISIPEFSVTALSSGNFFKHKWFVCYEQPIDPELVKNTIDEYLCEINDDYKTERSAFLGIELELVPPNMFYKWLENQGKSFGQSKVPRVMKAAQYENWQSFLKANNHTV